jgi:hypothetical protein
VKRTSWIIAAVMAAALGACGGDDDGVDIDGGPGADAAPPDAEDLVETCRAEDDAFVRNAFVALLGRRPLGQAEVNVYVDMLDQLEELDPGKEGTLAARRAVLDAIMDDPAFLERWTQYFIDALRVARIEDQEMRSCYGVTDRNPDTGELAAYVRDNAATAFGDGGGDFTMRDLLESALVLDDLSPVYRAHVFALVSRPIPAANVPRVEAELARREDFGNVFMSAYLNRDMVCLGCHNSEGSVTYSEDPAANRHWALPGLVEKALYGDSFGIATERAHAMFRYDGFVASGFFGDEGDDLPWSWSLDCGSFFRSGLEPDPADVDAKFADITGQVVTVYDLEAALKSGYDTVRANGLSIGSDGEIADPNVALAYMTAATVSEGVWREVIGTPLTIANYFPRNQAARDMLQRLTTTYIDSEFSLRAVLTEILLSEYFNRLPPEAGCGDAPYSMPNIYDPWTLTDPDVERRLNGSGDSVSALSARVLLRAAYAALEWEAPGFEEWPRYSSCAEYSCGQMNSFCTDEGSCCSSYQALCVSINEPWGPEEAAFQRGVGVFHKNAERGFRGLDFQARLLWEDRFGVCSKFRADADFVDALQADATAAGATVEELVVAMKDRIVGDASAVDDAAERAALEAVFGVGLDTAVTSVTDLDAKTRAVCGVLMSSPQFLLGGFAPDSAAVPSLTPAGASYDTACAEVAARGVAGHTLTCDGSGGLTIE